MRSCFAMCDSVGGQRLFAGAELSALFALVLFDLRIVSIDEGATIHVCKNLLGPVCISICRLTLDFVVKPSIFRLLLASRSQPAH